MDKALEKVSAAYPGPGRGVISTVEAIHFAIYDRRSQARDAVVVGGSDAAGTSAAVSELVRLIGKHCRSEVGTRSGPEKTPSSPPSAP